MRAALAERSAGALELTSYDSEQSAREALSRQDVDGAFLAGPSENRLLVAGVANDGLAVMTAAFEADSDGAVPPRPTGPTVPADHVARALTGLVGGFIVQYALLGPTAATGFRDGLRALLAGEVERYATSPAAECGGRRQNVTTSPAGGAGGPRRAML